MNSLAPKTYQDALERAQSRESRKKDQRGSKAPKKPSSGLQASRNGISRTDKVAAPKPRKPATAKPKRKKQGVGALKKKVWTEFSRFIRTRGAGIDGLNECFTCNILKHWKELQAGHFVRGRLNANLFDARGCKPQCYSCNIGKQGNVIPYYKRMLKLYGQTVIDSLIDQNNVTRKWQAGELRSLLETYRKINAANPLLDD